MRIRLIALVLAASALTASSYAADRPTSPVKQIMPLASAAFPVSAPHYLTALIKDRPSSPAQQLKPLAAAAFPIPVPQYLTAIINEASQKYGVDPNLIAAMAFRESRFDSRAVSRIGAQGVMQLMPRTARSLGVQDSFDARQNILGGTKYLRALLDRFNGDFDKSVAAYNAGPELVAKVGPSATTEAIEYLAAVKQFYQAALRAF
ncbi:MAG: transglycosylase SLT domain-containing protein [Thermoanaerobaculia bacterium]